MVSDEQKRKPTAASAASMLQGLVITPFENLNEVAKVPEASSFDVSKVTSPIAADFVIANETQCFPCPYHGPILQMKASLYRQGQELSPMERFLLDSPSEQYSLFHRPDSGDMSISKGCLCKSLMQAKL